MDARAVIDDYYERRDELSPQAAPADLRAAVFAAIDLLDRGAARVAEPDGNGGWRVNAWLKKAILLSFKIGANQISGDAGAMRFYDKVALKFADYDSAAFAKGGFRVAPPAVARRGAFIGKGVVLMPSYVNIGAFVGDGTMVDTWATVGSCAQIGRRVHLSGGAGIGGVLEPAQAAPTIIEDDCFIGARSEIVEGVIVGEGAVISMGVFIGQSTRILDRESGEILRGKIPPGSVVVPGALPAADGSHSLSCAVIVKKVDAQTRAKTAINEILRGV